MMGKRRSVHSSAVELALSGRLIYSCWHKVKSKKILFRNDLVISSIFGVRDHIGAPEALKKKLPPET